MNNIPIEMRMVMGASEPLSFQAGFQEYFERLRKYLMPSIEAAHAKGMGLAVFLVSMEPMPYDEHGHYRIESRLLLLEVDPNCRGIPMHQELIGTEHLGVLWPEDSDND